MRETRHLLTIILFFTASLGIIAFSIVSPAPEVKFQAGENQHKQESSGSELQNQSFFTDAHLFRLEETDPSLELKASELTTNSQTKRTLFLEPEGVVFSDNGMPINYKANRGHFIDERQQLFLVNDVDIDQKKRESELKADEVVYYVNQQKIHAQGNVKTKTLNQKTGDRIWIDAQEVISWPKKEVSEYHRDVEGEIVRQRKYEEGVEFSSDHLKMELAKQKISLRGDVFLKKQQLKARSLRGEIFLENYNKKLKYFVLYDDVKVEEKVVLEGDSYTRKAFAEKLTGLESEEKMILTGYPKVYQKSDVIKGNRIVLRENNEVIEVDDAQSQFILR